MKKFIVLILLVITQISIHAQLFPILGGQRAGISTAQFLKIGVGGRAAAMGEAFVAVANDVSALYWNPAGLVQFPDNQVMFSHNSWVVDISHEFVGASYHLSDMDVIGASVIALTTPDMERTTEFQPFGTGEFFSYSDIAVALTYSRKMTDKFSFGGTIRYIEETMDKVKQRGVMVDLGTYYWTGLGTSRFAVAVSNFGSDLTPDGTVTLLNKDKVSDWQSFSPPTVFRIGFAMEPYEAENHKLTTSIQINHPNDNSENVAVGVEYWYQEMVALRGGYKFNVDEQNISFGVGLKAPVSFARVTFDYGFTNFTKLGAAHRFSLILGF
ncbi:MAG: PorV/PorQ family protein [Ignavibacteria bacterium]|nr:PorV/PorQ family protein [Ignavibacteria bacterium]